MSEKQWYFEVHCRETKMGPLYWQRQPGSFKSFLEAQSAAIANNRRPYRIKSEVKQPTETANA